MTKKDIVKAIAQRFGLKQSCAKRYLDFVLDEIMRGAVANGRMELRGFGTFKIKWRRGRYYAHLQKPGQKIYVPPRPYVCFNPSKRFRRLLPTVTRKLLISPTGREVKIKSSPKNSS